MPQLLQDRLRSSSKTTSSAALECPTNSDNGTNFVAKKIEEYCYQFKIKHHRSFPYRPHTNGAVEAANKNVERILEKITQTYRDWHEKLSMLYGHTEPPSGHPQELHLTYSRMAWRRFYQLKLRSRVGTNGDTARRGGLVASSLRPASYDRRKEALCHQSRTLCCAIRNACPEPTKRRRALVKWKVRDL